MQTLLSIGHARVPAITLAALAIRRLVSRWSHVKADPREAQVHFAYRRVFVPDDNFVGRPGENAPVHGVAVVVGRDADPVAAPEADILRL